MKPEVLRALATGGFVSGEALGASAGVSRAALWKQIEVLRQDGAVIEASAGKGYRLISAPEVPRAEYVLAYLLSDVQVFYKDITESTNDDARAAARDAELERAAFISGQQTKGRGRKGRRWESPSGGLYISFLVRPEIDISGIPGITVMTAVSVCRALEKTSDKSPHIKWPNDILLGGKKLAGILTECTAGIDGLEYAVCGIGINTGRGPGGDIAARAASMDANRTLLAASITDAFFEAYDTFLKEGLSAFIEEFRRLNCLSGMITIISDNKTETGEFLGFDDSGALLLGCESGRKCFIAGEVSARGEGAYV